MGLRGSLGCWGKETKGAGETLTFPMKGIDYGGEKVRIHR